MTATAYESHKDKTAVQAILDANFTTGDRLEIIDKGNDNVLLIIYNTT